MKNITLLSIAALFGILIFNACDKDISQTAVEYNLLNPGSWDENAGTWKTVVLATPDEVAVPAPLATSSPEYQTELAATKQALAGLTDEQREAVNWWGGGSALRWNQILRDLVALHNLAPAPNEDGIYPFPDAANPFNYPQVPFANPPYSARAYANVAVAQYDALVAAWHYKQLYNRPAPYAVDNSIEALVSRSPLPSYPCEDAVMAGAAYVMLRALFPADTTYINEKVAEAASFKQWAGAAVASDVQAGLALGKAVAQKVLNRAKNDKMKFAVGNQGIWDSLQQSAETRGQIPWISLEAPHRPPMLPLFGQVTPFLFTPAEMVAIRPAAPPLTNTAEFQAELAGVKQEADPNDRDKIRIVHFWADGTGTYSPPGHWNFIAADLIYRANQSDVRAARTFALLGMAEMDAGITCWDTKFFYNYPRPTQMDPEIKTTTGVPNFPAYTSGHSTFSWAAATILSHLYPSEASVLESWANEAAQSRVYAGIHYPMDSNVGAASGRTVGAAAVARAQTDGAE